MCVKKGVIARGVAPWQSVPQNLTVWTHYDQNGNIFGLRIATSGYALLAMTRLFESAEIYSLVYNGCYMLPCALIALVIAGALYVPMKRFFEGRDLR